MRTKTLITTLCAIAALGGASTVSAGLRWLVDATFDDGSVLSGVFTLNAYGQLDTYSLTTQANPPFQAETYATGQSSSDGANFIDIEPTYKQDLRLTFADALTISNPENAILTSSFECQNSYSCYQAGGVETRHVVSGFATSVPESPSWALMIVGLAGLGYLARRRGAGLPTSV